MTCLKKLKTSFKQLPNTTVHCALTCQTQKILLFYHSYPTSHRASGCFLPPPSRSALKLQNVFSLLLVFESPCFDTSPKTATPCHLELLYNLPKATPLLLQSWPSALSRDQWESVFLQVGSAPVFHCLNKLATKRQALMDSMRYPQKK